MRGRVVVTGGAGFIGSRLVRQLLDRGLEVTVLDDLSMGQRSRVPAQARLVEADVREAAAVSSACAGVDAVIHLAARVSVRASATEFYEDAGTNVMGTLNVLRACAAQGVRKVVFASSMAVYADSLAPRPISEGYVTEPISAYGIAKLAGEKYCLRIGEQAGFESVILRYFNTFGPGQTPTPYVGVITIFIRRLLAGEPPVIFGDGEQRRDFVHVDDVAAATTRALDADVSGKIINIGTGIATSVNEIASLLRRKIAPEIAPQYAPPQSGELRHSIADIHEARRLLGYEPRHTLEGEIDRIIEWYRSAPRAVAHEDGKASPASALDRRPG